MIYIRAGGGGRGNNNHLMVEITDPDHYQNLIKRSLARGRSRQQTSWKFSDATLTCGLHDRGGNTTSCGDLHLKKLDPTCARRLPDICLAWASKRHDASAQLAKIMQTEENLHFRLAVIVGSSVHAPSSDLEWMHSYCTPAYSGRGRTPPVGSALCDARFFGPSSR